MCYHKPNSIAAFFLKGEKYMDLNLSILAEKLSEKVNRYKMASEFTLGISDVQLYLPDCFENNSSTLYLVRQEWLPIFLASNPTICFATTYCDDDTLLVHATQYIIFSKNISFEEAFAALRKAFASYRDWEAQIFYALVEQQPVEDVLSLCAQLLNNPIALFDSSFVLVATGGYIPLNNLDATWSGVLNTGYFSIAEQESGNEKIKWHGQYPIRVTTESSVMASCCIHHQGQLIGCIGMTDLCGPITDGQLSLIYVIQRIFETNSYLSNIQLSTDQRISVLLPRLLLGYNVEKSAIDYYLNTLSWRGDNTYRFNLITTASGEKLSTDEIAPTIQNMKPLFLTSIIFPFEDCIAIIAKENGIDPPVGSVRLGQFLRSRELMCIISTPFHDFGYLRHAYLQCRMLLPLLQGNKRPDVYKFSEYYQKCVLSALEDTSNLSALCDPTISGIYRKRNGKEFIHSLRVFLMHGKSYSEAAEELNIHRNTLIYRIEQMEKALDMDFHQTDEQELFRLYLSTLICEA